MMMTERSLSGRSGHAPWLFRDAEPRKEIVRKPDTAGASGNRDGFGLEQDLFEGLDGGDHGLGSLESSASFRFNTRISLKRLVTSRMMATMPIILPAFCSGTTVNSTEMMVPSLRTAGTESPSLSP